VATPRPGSPGTPAARAGTYYPLSNEFKTVVEDNTDFTLNVQSTGASVENVGSLANGDADFALIQNDIASFAKNGTGIEAFEGNAIENLMGVATLYPETITVVTLAETGIEQLTGLEGATINTGDLGSGTQVNALQILEAVGVEEFDEQNASSQAADRLPERRHRRGLRRRRLARRRHRGPRQHERHQHRPHRGREPPGRHGRRRLVRRGRDPRRHLTPASARPPRPSRSRR